MTMYPPRFSISFIDDLLLTKPFSFLATTERERLCKSTAIRRSSTGSSPTAEVPKFTWNDRVETKQL